MTVMYDKLDKALYRSRRSLLDVCNDMSINAGGVNAEELLNARCVNCGIWGNRFTEMVEEVCLFCDDLDTLRF